MVASVVPAAAVASIVDGVPVQNVAHREAWLWVTEQGGRVTPEYDVALFGDSLLPQPGPFRRAAPGLAATGDAVAAAASPRRTLLTGGTAGATSAVTPPVVYFNQDMSPGRYDPVPGARVVVTYTYLDRTTRQFVWDRAIQHTDAQGRFSVDCSVLDRSLYSGVQYKVEAFTANNRVQVGSVDGSMAGYYSQDLGLTCGGAPGVPDVEPPPAPSELVLESSHARVFLNMDRNAVAAFSIFGTSRPKLKVLLDASANHSSYRQDDVVVIASNPSHNRVWGPTGVFSQAHEFGHAFQALALGGIEFGHCPADRRLNGAYSIPCAYFEGYADFVAAALGAFTDHFEQNTYYPAPPEFPAAVRTDGSMIEGAVAALLLDLLDPVGTAGTSEAHDLTHLPGSYLAAAIGTCEVYVSGGYRRANGIDHLVYCLENTVDPAVTASPLYFYNRTADPSGQRNSAAPPAGWSLAAVRSVWTYDLFRYPRGTDLPYQPPCSDSPTLLQPCVEG